MEIIDCKFYIHLLDLTRNSCEKFTRTFAALTLPWIPEPSVNNKLNRREGSGSTGGFFD